ncbi:MAG: TonB-dependent receptor [Candidatus Glassbacteria bacterium]
MNTAAVIAAIIGATFCRPVRAAAEERFYELDTVVVEASRAGLELRQMPANVTVLTEQRISSSAALTLDEMLLDVPGFSLFRRSGSASAHPTTQGVSLRGIGASGSSRSLVLVDGMPLNDPFGGWVNWSRVRPGRVRRVEVMRGGTSNVWGNYALGGVINIITAPPGEKQVSVTASGGSQGTSSADFYAGGTSRGNNFSLEGSWFGTGGWPVLRADQRGAIDTEADSRNWSLAGKLSRRISDEGRLTVQTGFYGEKRSNGTPLTGNGTDGGWLSLRADFDRADNSSLGFQAFANFQGFHSTFSSQAADRSSETPSLDQYDVPASTVGAVVEWLKPFSARHLFTAGSDFRFVAGETNEYFFYSNGAFQRRRSAGGSQQLFGIFAQEVYTPLPKLQLSAGLRADYWQIYDGFRTETDRTTHEVLRDDAFSSRGAWELDPGAGLVYEISGEFKLRSSAYRTFRLPTLNELFRPFRVRNDVTEANERLDPERLTGVDGGLDYHGHGISAGITGYYNRVRGAIANRTVSTGGRQRANIGRLRVRGLEAEFTVQPDSRWSLSASYLFSSSVVTAAPLFPALDLKRPPQVPRHTFTAALDFADPRLVTISLQARSVSGQYEDDLNTLPLAGFATLDIYAERKLSERASVYFHAENLFDRVYETGRTADGLVSVGEPRRFGAGVRTRF